MKEPARPENGRLCRAPTRSRRPLALVAALLTLASPLPAQQVEGGAERGGGLAMLEELPLFGALDGVRSWGFTPQVRGVGPRSGLGLVLRFERFTPLFFESGISIRGSQLHRAGIKLGDPGAGAALTYTFRRDARDLLWGIGSDSRYEQRSDFLRDKSEAAAEGWIQLTPVVGLAAGIAFEDNRVGRGRHDGLPDARETFGAESPFGLGERAKFFRFDLSSTVDLVERRGFWRRGAWLRAGSSLFRGVDGTDSDFHRFHGELRSYLPIGSRQTFALRGLVELNRLDGGQGIPFYDLSRLGGSRNGPRGFESGRFRDRDGLSLMAEWRYAVWSDAAERRRLEGFLFFDAGGVTPSLSKLSGSDFVSSYGVGLRLTGRSGLATLGYLGFGEEGIQLGLRTGWPF